VSRSETKLQSRVAVDGGHARRGPRTDCEISRVFWEELPEHIPPEVSGGFVPSDPSITIGWHDVWEAAEREAGELFGRTSVSLSLAGHGSSRDSGAFQEYLFRAPLVRELRERFAAIAGTAEARIIWDV
jgi:hypothetical protein